MTQEQTSHPAPQPEKPMPPPPSADIEQDRREGAEERWETCPLHDCKRDADLLYSDFYLRDIRTNRLMCRACAVRVEMGYMAREVVKESDDRFYAGTSTDYAIVFGILFAGSMVVNALMLMIGFWILGLFIGGGAGTFLARLARQATGGRIGRQSQYVAVAGVIVGALFAPTLFTLVRIGALIFALQFAITNFAILLCTGSMAAAAYGIFLRRI